MGWTSYHAEHYDKHGKVDRKAECDKYCNCSGEKFIDVVLKSSMKGSVYYAAVERTDKKTEKKSTWGIVILTSVDNNQWHNFTYKPISEDMWPYYYDCPKGILDLLSPTTNENAVNWREQCRRNSKRVKPGELPVGTTIRFTIWNGETISIKKMPPAYQFKRNWWYDEKTSTYFKAKYIPEKFEIIA